MFSFVFPPLDPVLIEIGPIAIRWYALAYLAGFVVGWKKVMRLAAAHKESPAPSHYDDFISWAVIGTVLGGRLGYVLFYQAGYYFSHPLEALQIWHGGMSFHGGLLGVVAAAWLFTRARKISFLSFTDLLACVTPIGLGLGRLANFVNGELFGRPTDVPWAVIFPHGGDLPRHPSQLYEAAFEGLILYLILAVMAKRQSLVRKEGLLSGTFLALYALFRFGIEFFRQPDEQLGFLYAGATMGQLLCLPMFAFGFFLASRAIAKDFHL